MGSQGRCQRIHHAWCGEELDINREGITGWLSASKSKEPPDQPQWTAKPTGMPLRAWTEGLFQRSGPRRCGYPDRTPLPARAANSVAAQPRPSRSSTTASVSCEAAANAPSRPHNRSERLAACLPVPRTLFSSNKMNDNPLSVSSVSSNCSKRTYRIN